MHFLIIGVGSIGERHLRNFLKIDDVRCSIAETNPSTLEKMAAQYPVEKSYADYRDADLASFNGVIICTPANLHVPIATEVLTAGTHVLTEKPLALSRDGIDELKGLRDETRKVVSVAFPSRSDPILRELKERIDSHELGNVQVVNFYNGQYWPRMRKDYPPQYAQKRETGGGVITDMLVHMVNYLEWIFGPPDEVAAGQWRIGLKDIATEDTGYIVLRFTGGRIAFLSNCLFQRDSNSRFQFIAERGTFQIEHDSDTLRIFVDKSSAWKQGHARKVERDVVFIEQARHFIDCINGKATPRCNLEEGEQTVRTVLAALQSSDHDSGFVKVKR